MQSFLSKLFKSKESSEPKKTKKQIAREECIAFAVQESGKSEEFITSHLDDARARLGIKYYEYRNMRLWEIPTEEQESKYIKFREKAQKTRERKLEKKAVAARQEAVAQNGITTENIFSLCGSTETDVSPQTFVREKFGEDCLPETGKSREEYEHFVMRFEGRSNIDHTDDTLREMYADWLLLCKDIGYDMDDYFDYEFWNKDSAERNRFSGAGYREDLKKIFNTDRSILARKGKFLNYFGQYIQRPWLDCSACSREELEHFISTNPVFFLKEEGLSGGQGISRIKVSEEDPLDLADRLQDRNIILEGAIDQCEEMASFNEDTVNTVRVCTLASETGKIVFFGAAVRFGRKGCFTDNYHQGGLCALVDVDTGDVISNAIDRSGRQYESHPDSGKVFRGWTIPQWDEIKELVELAARSCIEKDRYIGWDIALTKQGIDMIEGNSRPGFDILQAPDMTGRKALMESYVASVNGIDTREENNG